MDFTNTSFMTNCLTRLTIKQQKKLVMKKITTIYLVGVFITLFTLIPLFSYAKWDAKTSIPTLGGGRWGAQCFALDGKIFVGGGYVGNNTNLRDLVSFDPATGQWNFHKDLPGKTSNRTGGIAFTINGKAYIGLGAENYNDFTGTWTFLTDLWQYDPSSDSWTEKATFPGTGVAFSGTFIIDNKFYVIGGTTGKQSADGTNKVYEYNPATDKWTQKADFPDPIIKNNPFGFALNNRGYISGGSNGSSISNKTYEYDPGSDTWTQKADFPESQINGGVSFVANGVAYCGLGGLGSFQYLDHFWYYDASTDGWAYANGFEFSDSRMWAITATVNNKIYMGAGWQINASSAQIFYNDWYEIDPSVAVNIHHTTHKNIFEVYPNPTTNNINLNTNIEYKNYRLYNITGEMVSSGSISGKSIPVSNVPNGQYILEVINETDLQKQLITIAK